MGSIYLLLVFVIIDTIKDAGMILALAGLEGGPGGKVTVPALFMIRKAFVEQEMGYACAVGIVLTVIVIGTAFVLISVSAIRARRRSPSARSRRSTVTSPPLRKRATRCATGRSRRQSSRAR